MIGDESVVRLPMPPSPEKEEEQEVVYVKGFDLQKKPFERRTRSNLDTLPVLSPKRIVSKIAPPRPKLEIHKI